MSRINSISRWDGVPRLDAWLSGSGQQVYESPGQDLSQDESFLRALRLALDEQTTPPCVPDSAQKGLRSTVAPQHRKSWRLLVRKLFAVLSDHFSVRR